MNASGRTFVFLTPEYPPDSGGIGDYVALLAKLLAARGARVVVQTRSPPDRIETPGVEVELLPDDFGPATRRFLARSWASLPAGAVVIVQYVPHGFGMKGMNLPFARFLAGRRERLWLMLHEVIFPFVPGQSLKRDVLAVVTRVMLRFAGTRAERAFVSTPAWEPWLRRYARADLPCEWLPIPATATAPGPAEKLVPWSTPTIAHFGTYGSLVAGPLERIVLRLLAGASDLELVLIGRGSEAFRAELVAEHAELTTRLRATGAVPPERVSFELARAWVTLFPFDEGVTTQRTSLMSALAAGAVIVTTDGYCTESVWRRSGAVELVDASHLDAMAESAQRLLADAPRRNELRRRAQALYAERFDAVHVVKRLCEAYAGVPGPASA